MVKNTKPVKKIRKARPKKRKTTPTILRLKDPQAIRSYYQKIISCMPNNVYWLDKNCITQGCNENVLKLIGLDSLEQFVGITYEEMGRLAGWTEGQAESFKRDDMEVMSTGIAKLNIEEPPLYDAKGNPVYYMSSRVPLLDDEHQVIGVIGISVDITERKKYEQALKEAKERAEVASQAKSYFMASLGHEFRTPLTHVIGISEVLKTSRDKISLSEQDDYLDAIHDAGNDLLTLINDSILFSRMEMGYFKIDRQNFNLQEIIEKVLRNTAHNLEEKNLTLHLDYSLELPRHVSGDPQRVRQVLVNLLTNSIKFTEQGNVTIKIEYAQKCAPTISHLRINIIDTGIGIAADKMALLFKKFSQVHSEYTDQRMGRYRGIGLGLAIAKELVELMDGEIGVHSILGQGSTFFFTLPLEKPVDNIQLEKNLQKNLISDVIQKEKYETSDKKNSKHFLLVEDDLIARRFAEMILKHSDCQVDIAKNGREALELLNKNNYDMVLMDIGLPDMKGTEVVAEFRRMEDKRKRTPIVALSAQGLDEGKEAALEAGMDEYMEKPLNNIKLKALLKHWFTNTTMS